MSKIVLRGKPKMNVIRYKVMLSTSERNWLTDLLRKELQFTNEMLADKEATYYDHEVGKEEKNIMESLLYKLGEGVR